MLSFLTTRGLKSKNSQPTPSLFSRANTLRPLHSSTLSTLKDKSIDNNINININNNNNDNNDTTSLEKYISGMKILTSLEHNIWKKSIGQLVWKTLLEDRSGYAENKEKEGEKYNYDFSKCNMDVVEEQ